MATLDAINRRMGRNAVICGASGVKRDWKMAATMKNRRFTTDWEQLCTTGCLTTWRTGTRRSVIACATSRRPVGWSGAGRQKRDPPRKPKSIRGLVFDSAAVAAKWTTEQGSS